jgi:hypothetical protein
MNAIRRAMDRRIHFIRVPPVFKTASHGDGQRAAIRIDYRDTMILGNSGILSIKHDTRPGR